jgi:hypothetical protein
MSFTSSDEERQRYALCIRLAGFDRPGRAPALSGAFQRVTFWEFGVQDVPWPTTGGMPARHREGPSRLREGTTDCPPAQDLWDWALGARPMRATAARYLGVLL